MACSCCAPPCSCKAIADNLDLISIDYSFKSDWAGGGAVNGTLSIAGNPNMAARCEVTDTQYTIGKGGFETPCKNDKFPRVDNSATRVKAVFSYSCNSAPTFAMYTDELIGASRNGIFVPGCYYCACTASPTFLLGGTYFEYRRVPGTLGGREAEIQPSITSYATTLSWVLNLNSSNYDVFRTVDGTPWSSIGYPAKLRTSQTTFSREWRSRTTEKNIVTASATLNFNELP